MYALPRCGGVVLVCCCHWHQCWSPSRHTDRLIEDLQHLAAHIEGFQLPWKRVSTPFSYVVGLAIHLVIDVNILSKNAQGLWIPHLLPKLITISLVLATFRRWFLPAHSKKLFTYSPKSSACGMSCTKSWWCTSWNGRYTGHSLRSSSAPTTISDKTLSSLTNVYKQVICIAQNHKLQIWFTICTHTTFLSQDISDVEKLSKIKPFTGKKKE